MNAHHVGSSVSMCLLDPPLHQTIAAERRAIEYALCMCPEAAQSYFRERFATGPTFTKFSSIQAVRLFLRATNIFRRPF